MTKRFPKEQNIELKYKALLEQERGKMKKRLHNHLVFQQIHFPHEKRIKVSLLSLFSKGVKKRLKVDTYDQVSKTVLK